MRQRRQISSCRAGSPVTLFRTFPAKSRCANLAAARANAHRRSGTLAAAVCKRLQQAHANRRRSDFLAALRILDLEGPPALSAEAAAYRRRLFDRIAELD